MGLPGNGMPRNNHSRNIRHDSPMGTGTTYNDPIDLDDLPDPVLPSSSHRPQPATMAPRLKQTTIQHLTITKEIGEASNTDPRLKPDYIESLPAPIPESLPKNDLKIEDASDSAKTIIMKRIAVMASGVKNTDSGRPRAPEQRKACIQKHLPFVNQCVSTLEPEDQIACIEQFNIQVVWEHNKTLIATKHEVELVPFPPEAVAKLRQTYSLVPTPPAMIFQQAESLTAWPVEFQHRLPLVRKQQLEDLASGYSQVNQTWDKRMRKDFVGMWVRLCYTHNDRLTVLDPDYVVVGLVRGEVGDD
ncbi:hypothetical protein M409DRAFT_61011 [Zasmidium cellare ATCC 36951]|uniref:Uncharacterized protein n=1 Tax=Zasmidium cellare ATCC 36951 TaxID=1080233 RepID=A0A6A6BWV6_ZASCE|nr:uncharacterized protein M409DRAFT_61011 [Zasmidium cellare ATCC 36951]KAF2159185.1 hypothetical protein M409DRAFT_61011 [Zasmidium cellare ATCC 36951]